MTVLCFHLDTVLFENNENSDPGSSKGCAYALTLERVPFFFFFFYNLKQIPIYGISVV